MTSPAATCRDKVETRNLPAELPRIGRSTPYSSSQRGSNLRRDATVVPHTTLKPADSHRIGRFGTFPESLLYAGCCGCTAREPFNCLYGACREPRQQEFAMKQ